MPEEGFVNGWSVDVPARSARGKMGGGIVPVRPCLGGGSGGGLGGAASARIGGVSSGRFSLYTPLTSHVTGVFMAAIWTSPPA